MSWRSSSSKAYIKRQSAGAGAREAGGALHRYSNSSSAYFSEYSISWLMVLRARDKLVRA